MEDEVVEMKTQVEKRKQHRQKSKQELMRLSRSENWTQRKQKARANRQVKLSMVPYAEPMLLKMRMNQVGAWINNLALDLQNR